MEFYVAVEMVDIWRNTGGESGSLGLVTDVALERGERTGLDTLVVHVNDEQRDPFRDSVPC